EVQALIDARYYYGEPVPGAKVTYVVHRSYYWSPWYEPEEQPEFESGDQPEYYAGEQVLEESGALDAEGKLAIRFPAPELRHDSRYRIEARVTDAAGREIAGVGWAIATVGSYQIHIQAESYVYTPGQRARFRVETRDYDGKPVPNAAFRAEMSDERWPRPQRRIVTGTQGTTGADGKATFELPVESGLFAVRAVSRTPEGREVESSTFVWGSGGAEWYGPRSQRVQIVPDKRSYKPGETARVLIVTGVPEAHVWVTVEGRAIRSSRAVHVKGATATVEVPIDRGFAPNFYVAASFIRDNQLYQGVKSITVPPEEQTLSVAVKTSKPRFLPGESGTISIEAKDHRGLPVAAEFSLGVVDEAIYAIRRDAAEDMLKFFYGRTYNSVAAASSLEYYFHGEAGRRRMQLARIRPPGALAVIKPERLVEPRIRKAFPDTILWLADLKTDAQGRAEARVAFPDSLTTWRATARGVTSDTKVGSALEKAIVRKNVIVRLAVPRFFTEGDEVTVSAIVSNYLPVEKQVRVSLAVEGLELIEGRPGDVTVPTRGQAQVDYRVRASRIGTATLVAKGLTDVESDALELEIPVRPAGVKLAEARAGSITGGGGSAEAELVFPPDAAGASRSLEITLTPSVAGAIFGALDYLTTFPYGCTEQTMSSFLPNVIVSQAVKELGLQSSVNQSDLLKKIRAGLERLYDFQHEDGGWGWWKSDDSEAFMTAYVYFGLQRAQAAGYQVRTDVISKARGYLRQAFANQKPGDVKAYMLLALVQGEDRDQTWFDSLWNDRGSLSAYGQALLGLAMRAAGDGRADQLAATLERTAEVRDGEAFWKVDRDGLLDIYQDATVEATAHALKFLAAQRPSGPLLAKAALYLVNHRDEGYYWTSTKQTAMVIYGLTDYLKTTGELRPNHAATVWVNGRQVASKRFTEADALKPAAASIRLTGAELSAGRNAIRIAKSGPGRLYWSAREEYFSTSGRRERAGSVKLNLVREYFRLLPVRSADRVVHELEPLAGEVQRGDVLAVRLTLSGGDWRYLMIEDPIPAGAEFIERDDLYQLTETPVWWRWMASRREFHDDRAAFFQRYFNAGQDQYVYLLKVVNPGRFRVNPAKVQPMYQPQLFATSDARILEVK
ncbi:MAG: alpha-2-macroglobulin, partial [Acidobacteria bacterium]|nr:alpha-2-macroglobulin [Acidobacteriota bacterium]